MLAFPKSFENRALSTWKNECNIMENLNEVARDLREWNANVFGNVFIRKKILISRIAGIQRFLESCSSIFLERLEKELIREFEIVLKQEDDIWH